MSAESLVEASAERYTAKGGHRMGPGDGWMGQSASAREMGCDRLP